MRYTVKQVAAIWGVSPHTIYNLIDRRELSCIRIGRTVRIRDEDIQEYEKRCHQPANDNLQVNRIFGDTQTGGYTPSGLIDVLALARQTWKPPKVG
jgi:excisionase family DNA binding protein